MHAQILSTGTTTSFPLYPHLIRIHFYPNLETSGREHILYNNPKIAKRLQGLFEYNQSEIITPETSVAENMAISLGINTHELAAKSIFSDIDEMHYLLPEGQRAAVITIPFGCHMV